MGFCVIFLKCEISFFQLHNNKDQGNHFLSFVLLSTKSFPFDLLNKGNNLKINRDNFFVPC